MNNSIKVDSNILSYIQNVVQTADLIKIDSIIIEPNKVRAVDEDKTVVILQDKNVPDMPFGSIGLNRTEIFTSRLELAKSAGNFEVEALIDEMENKNTKQKEHFARALIFKGKGVKVDYRCANPLLIKAPKTLNDYLKFKVSMTPETVLMIQKGYSAMKTDELTLNYSKDGVILEMNDINGDSFTYKISNEIETLEGNSSDFSYKYPIKTLLPLFKTVPESDFYISSRGMLKIEINKLNIYVLPKV